MSDKAKNERERREQPHRCEQFTLGTKVTGTAVICILVGAAVFVVLFGFPFVLPHLALLIES